MLRILISNRPKDLCNRSQPCWAQRYANITNITNTTAVRLSWRTAMFRENSHRYTTTICCTDVVAHCRLVLATRLVCLFANQLDCHLQLCHSCTCTVCLVYLWTWVYYAGQDACKRMILNYPVDVVFDGTLTNSLSSAHKWPWGTLWVGANDTRYSPYQQPE